MLCPHSIFPPHCPALRERQGIVNHLARTNLPPQQRETVTFSVCPPIQVNSAIHYRLGYAKVGLVASLTGALSAPLTNALADPPSRAAWLIDLAAHWQWQYLIVGLACAAVLLWRRGNRWTIPALAVVIVGVAWTSPRAEQVAPHGAPSLTLVTANVHFENSDTTPLQRWVQTIDADVVVIQEVSPATAAQLERWDDFPFRVITPDESPFGLAILSRYPMLDIEARRTDGQPLHFRTHILWHGRAIALAAVHPMPPLSPDYHLRRAQLLKAEATWAADTETPAIVAGDLNATPWSAAMQGIEESGLRRATGLTPTWPATLPTIPIDHILVTADWLVSAAGVGPNVGSDHRPAYASLALRLQ